MGYFDKVVRNEPDGLFGGHPIEVIEAGQIDRTRVGSQSALAPHVEVDIEVAHGELAQAAIDRLAVAAAGVVRLGNRSPMAPNAINGQNVIGVVLGLEVDDKRRESERAQGCGSEDRSFEAMGSLLAQHDARRPGRVLQVVGSVVEETLNAVGIFEAAQLAQLGGSECSQRVAHVGMYGSLPHGLRRLSDRGGNEGPLVVLPQSQFTETCPKLHQRDMRRSHWELAAASALERQGGPAGSVGLWHRARVPRGWRTQASQRCEISSSLPCVRSG